MNLIILSQHRPNLAGHRASFDETVEVSRIVTSIRLGISTSSRRFDFISTSSMGAQRPQLGHRTDTE